MTSTQPHTESTLLTRFLLPPSSLTTILPYKAFLDLCPNNIRNDATFQRPLRKLYAELQFQRNIDIDNVRANIQRECARSGALKAKLRKDVAREMNGEHPEDEVIQTIQPHASRGSPEIEPSRKRKRSETAGSQRNNDEPEPTSSDEDSLSEPDEVEQARSSASNDNSSSDDEVPESPNHASSPPSDTTSPEPTYPTNKFDHHIDTAFHGPRGLALPSSYTAHQPQSTYHSRDSLLSAMSAAVEALEMEIGNLDTEAIKLMKGMQETVGGLSDLRYGKLGRESGGTSLEASLEEDLRGLRGALEGRK